MTAQVQFSMKVPVKITQKGKWFLASCAVLDVHSQGETANKAKKNLQESIALFLMSCIERGTLDAVLKQCGIAVYPGSSRVKKTIAVEDDYLNIPIFLLANQNNPDACHA